MLKKITFAMYVALTVVALVACGQTVVTQTIVEVGVTVTQQQPASPPPAVESVPATETAQPPEATLRPAPSALPDGQVTYSSPQYGASISVPAGWQLDLGYGTDHLAGPDGFVQIGAASGPADVEALCQIEAEHVLMPYGPSPTIEPFVTAGGAAGCIIVPSTDPPTMYFVAFAYPEPPVVGGVIYEYVTLVGDADHIRAIASSLQFNP